MQFTLGLSWIDNLLLYFSIYRITTIDFLALFGVVAVVCVVTVSIIAIDILILIYLSLVSGFSGALVLAIDILFSFAVLAVDVLLIASFVFVDDGFAFTPIAATIVSGLIVIAIVSVVAIVVAVVGIGGVISIVTVLDIGLALVHIGTLIDMLTVVDSLTFALVNIGSLRVSTLVDILSGSLAAIIIIAVIDDVRAVVIHTVVIIAVVIVAIVDIFGLVDIDSDFVASRGKCHIRHVRALFKS